MPVLRKCPVDTDDSKECPEGVSCFDCPHYKEKYEAAESRAPSGQTELAGYVPNREALALTVAMTKLETKEILYAATTVLLVRKDGRKWAKLLIDNFEK